MDQTTRKVLNWWQSLFDFIILMSLVGLVCMAVIYYGKIDGGCNDDSCFDANHPRAITIGDLISATSTYITTLILGITGRFALVLHYLSPEKPVAQTELKSEKRYKQLNLPKIIAIISGITIAIIALHVWATLPACSLDNQSISSFCSSIDKYDVINLATILHFILPSGIGAGFAAVFVPILISTRSFMRKKYGC